LCKDRARLALLVVVLANQKRPCIAVALPFSGDEDKIGGSAIQATPLAANQDLIHSTGLSERQLCRLMARAARSVVSNATRRAYGGPARNW